MRVVSFIFLIIQLIQIKPLNSNELAQEYSEIYQSLTQEMKLILFEDEEDDSIIDINNCLIEMMKLNQKLLEANEKLVNSLTNRIKVKENQLRQRESGEVNEEELKPSSREYFINKIDKFLAEQDAEEISFLMKMLVYSDQFLSSASHFTQNQSEIKNKVRSLYKEKHETTRKNMQFYRSVLHALQDTISDTLSNMILKGVELDPWNPTVRDVEEMEERRLKWLYILTEVQNPLVENLKEAMRKKNMTLSEFCTNVAISHKLTYLLEDCALRSDQSCFKLAEKFEKLFKISVVLDLFKNA